MMDAKRTAVGPRNGAFKEIEAYDLAAPVLQSLLTSVDIVPREVEQLILGNALYGGGNPARMASLAAGFPYSLPAITVDTQCCSGMDAISLAVQKIRAHEAEVILAGGLESYSRSPIRMHRPKQRGENAIAYERPLFSPNPEDDPDPIEAAAISAQRYDISRRKQEEIAIGSHRKSLKDEPHHREIVTVNDISHDTFTRPLDQKFCDRLKPLAGHSGYEVTAATIAVEADAAAAVLLVSEDWLRDRKEKNGAIEVIDTVSVGSDPQYPLEGITLASRKMLEKNDLRAEEISVVEAMEAFAVQIPRFLEKTGIEGPKLNRGGGGLCRGHPIGASGAINAVRLWHEMQQEPVSSFGVATIAAVGGLGSALLLRKSDLA
ncbi:MAG: thiolase family protein [Sneathiellales bacterium]|nr:thiolase family protein [Sneathiellales bacterium]